MENDGTRERRAQKAQGGTWERGVTWRCWGTSGAGCVLAAKGMAKEKRSISKPLYLLLSQLEPFPVCEHPDGSNRTASWRQAEHLSLSMTLCFPFYQMDRVAVMNLAHVCVGAASPPRGCFGSGCQPGLRPLLIPSKDWNAQRGLYSWDQV